MRREKSTGNRRAATARCFALFKAPRFESDSAEFCAESKKKSHGFGHYKHADMPAANAF